MEIRNLDVGRALHDYNSMWETQRDLHAQVVAGNSDDVFLLLEHEPVFTAGRRTEQSDLPADAAQVVDVDRGGRITWHGPGQIVGYAITRLPQPMDVVAHVRRLESVMTLVCDDYGLQTKTIPGRSGLWTATETPSKIGAVGVRVAQGVTLHGLSLNVDCDLSWANEIVPCGIADAGVTSMSKVLGQPVSTLEVAQHFVTAIESTWATDQAVRTATKVES